MPNVRKTYKKLYGADITEDIKSKAHPTQKCLIELASKVPPASKKVWMVNLTVENIMCENTSKRSIYQLTFEKSLAGDIFTLA